MCGSDELQRHPVSSFTYRNEQVRENAVQRVIVYIVLQICDSSSLLIIHVLHLLSKGDGDGRL